MMSRAITIIAYPAESFEYVCFASLRQYWNSPWCFSFFTALFSWVTNKNLPAWSLQFNLLCTDGDNRSYRNACNMSFVSFSLAVIFIVKLFSTSAFRVPTFSCRYENYKLPHHNKYLSFLTNTYFTIFYCNFIFESWRWT